VTKRRATGTTAKGASSSVRAFEAAVASRRDEPYELCLYIAGTTPLSSAAVAEVISICEQHLEGRYDLVVVDVYQEPARAKADQVIVVPTLLRKRPLPLRRLVGDLSNRAQVLAGLSLPADPGRTRAEEAP
jgi:circadian clock protein KaiB